MQHVVWGLVAAGCREGGERRGRGEGVGGAGDGLLRAVGEGCREIATQPGLGEARRWRRCLSSAFSITLASSAHHCRLPAGDTAEKGSFDRDGDRNRTLRQKQHEHGSLLQTSPACGSCSCSLHCPKIQGGCHAAGRTKGRGEEGGKERCCHASHHACGIRSVDPQHTTACLLLPPS